MADNIDPISKYVAENGGLEAPRPMVEEIVPDPRRFLPFASSETVLTS
jgi:hypothetical protein